MVQKMAAGIFAREPHKGVNPDEVVALGAAIQAGVLTGEVRDVLLLDVTPLTLGIETLGGVSTSIIERNTTIPTRRSQIFSTAADAQTAVEIHVLQGERKMASDNRTLGRFILDGIPPAPRGMPQIEVTFDIDANGIVHVTAKDKATSKEQKIRIEATSGLTETEIKKMVTDAEQLAREDEARREKAEKRNMADSLVYEVEKALKEYGEKIDPALRAKLDSGIASLRSAIEKNDDAAIETAANELREAWSQAGAAIYSQYNQSQQTTGQQEPQGQAGGGQSSEGPRPVDADYEVVDET